MFLNYSFALDDILNLFQFMTILPSPQKPNTIKRLTQLDSLRGLAALSVFFEHYTNSYNIRSATYRFAYFSPLHILWNGHAAVLLFFILSGFVLSLPFINNEKPLQIIEFYVKRIFRIYPAFLLAILIALILKYYFYDVTSVNEFSLWFRKPWAWNWNSAVAHETLKTFTLIGKFNPDLIIPAIWSLIIEMRISIILPFLIIIASRGNLLFNLLFFLVLTYWGQTSETALGVFFIGILIAKYKEPLITKLKSQSNWFIAMLILFAIVLYTIDFTFGLNTSHAIVRGIINYSVSIGSGIFIIVLISRPKAADFLKRPVFIFLGEVSYSFYLIHMPILYVMCSVFSFKYTLSPLYILLSSLSISFILSYIMLVGIERPFQKLAKKIISKYSVLRRGDIRTN